MNCPDCKGVGKIYGFGCPGFRLMEMPCTTCDGTGQMDAGYVGRKIEGAKYRHDRLSRKQTLRTRAIHLGVDPAELSRYERGMVVSEESREKIKKVPR